MKTDSWFYRLLKAWPAVFFALLGLPVTLAQRYRFDSVELKKEAWRIDGVFRPLDDRDPFFVLETQAYLAPTFYANMFAKVFGYLELNNPAQDWRAVAIFVERSFEPKETQPYDDLLLSSKVTRIYLDELPPQADPSLALGIWELVSASEDRTRELAPRLVAKAKQELSDGALCEQMIQLVEEFLIKRFGALTPEEIRAMLELPDIRDTRFYKDVHEEGLQEGMKKGISIGERKAKEKMARKLLAEGVAAEKIAKAAGLSTKEVRRLAKPKE